METRELLTRYVETRSDCLFQELVSRYVTLVYSAALRIVEGDTHMAEDVTQIVFLDLARTAATLSQQVMLGGWLHRHTCFVASNMLRADRRRHLREKQAVEMNAIEQQGADQSEIRPILDRAINQLTEPEQSAILLRFFEERDFRSIAAAMGTTEDGARMRVNRALDKLESILSGMGIKTTAATLALAISADLVHAAPSTLSATICASVASATTAPALAGSSTVAKTLTMTTLQKTLIGTAFLVTITTAAYQAQQSSALRLELKKLRNTERELRDDIAELHHEYDRATGALSAANERVTLLEANNSQSELLKLRGEVARLRQAREQQVATETAPSAAAAKSWLKRVSQLKQYVQEHPEEAIPEFEFLTEREWLNAADAGLKTETFERTVEYQRALDSLRFGAEINYAHRIQDALRKYSAATQKAFPFQTLDLQPHCDGNVAALLPLYEIKPADVISEALRKEYKIPNTFRGDAPQAG